MLTTVKLQGLTSQEAQQRLHQYGLNQLASERTRPLGLFLSKFRGPIPWMLEATLILQLALGKTIEGFIIAVLLVVNALISYSYERKAQTALALLQERLQIQTRVLRDDEWQIISAQELVPGDIVRLRVGDMVPADAQIITGQIGVDQSSLTGETGLVELKAQMTVYAASVIRRGEAIVEINTTGSQTSYGVTAQLVQTAKSGDHGDAFVQKIVLYLMGFTGVLVVGVLIGALVMHLALADALLFTLALLIAAIPVSLPVTFTLATAVGSRELARHGVLVTRLAAIKEAAGMDVLCSDKTGTITTNQLTVVAAQPYHGFSKSKLLRLAALASDDSTHDPIDIAILNAAQAAKPQYRKAERLEFTPFDPTTKRTEALIDRGSKGKKNIYVMKGSPHIISRLISDDIDLMPDVERLADAGNRCIAIAAGKIGKPLKLVGLLALQDPPRNDSAAVVSRLHGLGVRVMMITGDGLATARSIAQKIGIIGPACPPEALKANLDEAAAHYDVFAGVYPEDKYKLIQALQKAGHIVGMTGDGINDAPAIRQAEIGIAMNNATDITKSAASLVLTAPGLTDMLAAVEVGRSIFQRILTYTLNKIIKTFHLGLFLSLGLVLTGALIAKPIHILLLVLANDLVSMSLTTDRVRPSPSPNRWRVFPIIAAGLSVALGWLVFSFGIYFIGRNRLATDQLYTLTFLMLVAVAQANVYLIRERHYFWNSRPSKWMLWATTLDLILVSALALLGILMASVDARIVLGLLIATIGFMTLLDLFKVKVFQHFDVQ